MADGTGSQTSPGAENSHHKYLYLTVDPQSGAGKLTASGKPNGAAAAAAAAAHACDQPAEHICYKCGVAFLTRDSLQTHVDAHATYESMRYSCGMCLSQLPSLQTMIEHTKVVVCTQCNMAYPCVRHARAHMKCHPARGPRVSIPRVNSTVPTPAPTPPLAPPAQMLQSAPAVSSSRIISITPRSTVVGEQAGMVAPLNLQTRSAAYGRPTSSQPQVVATDSLPVAEVMITVKPDPDAPTSASHVADGSPDGGPTGEDGDDGDAHGKPHRCNNCGISYKHANHLSNHMKTHTQDLPYKCHICGLGFVVNFKYQRHMQKFHSGETMHDRPFKCDVCGSGFKQRNHLVQHNRTHTGEKPYKCGVCGTAFALLGNLNYHMRIHGNLKPYNCDVCCQSFRSSTHLKHHFSRIHKGIVNRNYSKTSQGASQPADIALFPTNLVNPLEGNPIDANDSSEDAAEPSGRHGDGDDELMEAEHDDEDSKILQEILREGEVPDIAGSV
ncbi:PREDICTED: zinc finger protein 226-like [Priapulus caudatus]|uniref:Zinc finger protein 226-like n=1 Tax=Priapulus caudatus TaxID=37621 RepID=A0ABM1EA63_PRICU|nr:PREDICTED: zinc finger protein 226-like [Priapulus caudatus]XP_014669080.1 PREDICTED: zinc finger protein 226-like [Priapulus caudatus]XP_014669081.1 PREDICTED: zinc finger protein 226-like [Priapulus caudatus]XP_014669083.1 PREDICTED: zinc finger protein 226-like [Priapulus caudatus]XP_014669084.1 PREDICTED: zinc finger protein 226-like [Priapulus caudatus]